MFLDSIAAEKRAEVRSAKEIKPLEELVRAAGEIDGKRSLVAAIAAPGMSIIAEVKRRSPSAGDFGVSLSPSELAGVYERAGAAAISVLTDSAHFGGSLEDLVEAEGATSLPVMRKDFVIDEYQLYEARAAGADGVLLIAKLLKAEELGRLLAVAMRIGLDALVEVHDREDLEKALDTEAVLIGINSRSLRTLEVNTDLFYDILPLLPPDRLVVAESGISEARELRALFEAGIDGALIGSALMRSDDPGCKLKELVQGVKE